MSAHDYKNAAAWVDLACEAAMQRGELVTIETWLDALPTSIVAEEPSLNLVVRLGFVFARAIQ